MRSNRWWRRAGLLAGVTLLAMAAALLPAGCGSSHAEPPKTSAQPAKAGAEAGQPKAAEAAPAESPAAQEPSSADQGATDQAREAKPGAAAQPAATAAAESGSPAAAAESAAQAPAAASAPMASEAAAGAMAPSEPAGLETTGSKIGWGRDYRTWSVVTGFVVSRSHGNRLVQTYITPPKAAAVYKHNAELTLMLKKKGFEDYPPGTQIAMESWLRNAVGGAGKPGPVFFMRKREDGYDPSGNNWEYGFTRSDLGLIGVGHDGKMQFCKDCHGRVSQRDFVWAVRN